MSTFCSKMEQNGSVKDSVPNSVLKNQTDISTGIGPTGTDTPAPKDLMPHADEQVRFPNCIKRPFGLCRRINIALVKMLELNTNGDIHRVLFITVMMITLIHILQVTLVAV